MALSLETKHCPSHRRIRTDSPRNGESKPGRVEERAGNERSQAARHCRRRRIEGGQTHPRSVAQINLNRPQAAEQGVSMQLLCFAFGILFLPFAFDSVRAQAADTKSGTASISGSVMLKGEPARGVVVILQPGNQATSNSPRARTDESGRFSFT